jgi:hypothetical protein
LSIFLWYGYERYRGSIGDLQTETETTRNGHGTQSRGMRLVGLRAGPDGRVMIPKHQRVQIEYMVHEYFEIVLGGQFDHLELELRFGSSSEPPSEDPFEGRDHSRSARWPACGQCWLLYRCCCCCCARLLCMQTGPDGPRLLPV